MAPRLELQTLLESLTPHVYFQPPPKEKMQYPCIMYERSGTSAEHADNELYRHAAQYQVTVVDQDPDTEIKDMVERLRYSAFDRFYAAENLNHFVFTLFF